MEKRDLKEFLSFVYEFYRAMRDHEITLVYEGEITHQIMKAFTSLTEFNMAKDDEPGTVQRKVFHVMVECLQNISKHAENPEEDVYFFSGRGIFLVSRGEKEYKIITGNMIENTKRDELSSNLDYVNNMSKEELKELFKNRIKEGRLSKKGGAGLGFIDIRRKTGLPLEYHFIPVDENNSFFILISMVSRDETEEL